VRWARFLYASVAGFAAGACGLESGGPLGAADAGGDASTGLVDARTDVAMSGAEDCLDGVDNDRNGLVDCADPACAAGYVCVEAAPGGGGFLHARRSAYGSGGMPACADGSAPVRYWDGPDDTPATCTGCTCGAFSGATCKPPTLLLRQGCGGNPLGGDSTTGCKSRQKTQQTTSAQVLGDAAWNNDGACPPSQATVTRSDPWSRQDDVCPLARTGGGCGARVCVPKPDADHPALCVQADGDAAAPACPSAYPTRIDAFAAYADNRGCSACACTPSAACSGGAYQIYGCDTSCSGNCPMQPNPPPLSAGGSCIDASNYVGPQDWSFKLVSAPTVSGSCTPSTAPTGAVVRTKPAIFCCAP